MTLGQLCAWRLEPTPRASRLNTREKSTSFYTLIYRLSAIPWQYRNRQNKTKKKRIKGNNKRERRKEKDKKGVFWTSFTGCWKQALVAPRLVGHAVPPSFCVPRSANWPWTGLHHVPLYPSTPGYYTPPVTNPHPGYRTLSDLPSGIPTSTISDDKKNPWENSTIRKEKEKISLWALRITTSEIGDQPFQHNVRTATLLSVLFFAVLPWKLWNLSILSRRLAPCEYKRLFFSCTPETSAISNINYRSVAISLEVTKTGWSPGDTLLYSIHQRSETRSKNHPSENPTERKSTSRNKKWQSGINIVIRNSLPIE